MKVRAKKAAMEASPRTLKKHRLLGLLYKLKCIDVKTRVAASLAARKQDIKR